MSLPGVESARRRRVSHGRSSLGFLQPPPLHRRSYPNPAPPAAPPPSRRFPGPDDQCRESLSERALAARHRLDERLRAYGLCTPRPINRRHNAGVVQPPRANEKLHRRITEEKFVPQLIKMGGHEDDCPVCLDALLSGQTVVRLPCHHIFHSNCIFPWLQSHCHCPSCRANMF